MLENLTRPLLLLLELCELQTADELSLSVSESLGPRFIIMIWAAACRAEHFSSKESRNDEAGRLVSLVVVDEDDMVW